MTKAHEYVERTNKLQTQTNTRFKEHTATFIHYRTNSNFKRKVKSYKTKISRIHH